MHSSQDRSNASKAAFFVVLIAVVLMAWGIYFVFTLVSTPAGAPARVGSAAPSAVPTPVPAQLQSFTVQSWSGSTNKQTETFSIPSHEWIIEWRSTKGYFSIAVRDPDGKLVDRAVDLIGRGQDTTIMRGAGHYFLDINARSSYSITVSAYR